MKGPALVSTLALCLVLGSACAGKKRPEPMPDWSPKTAEVVDSSPSPSPSPSTVNASDDSWVRTLDHDDSWVRTIGQDDHPIRVPRHEVVPDIWPASGLYLGGALITSQPMGDFDGDKAYSGTTDLVLIPDVDVGAGAGLYLSYRWHMNELQVQYSITDNDGSFTGSPRNHDTRFYDLDVNWRHYFWEKSPLQPYGLLGLGWSRAKIDNGSTDQATQTVFEDAELRNGINMNVGAGVALYTLPWVVFYGQGMYRFVRYETSDGIDGSFRNVPNVDGKGWNVSIGAAIRLLPPRK